MESKVCLDCGENKPLEDYHYAYKHKGVKKSYCKECSYIRAQEHIAKDPIAYHHYLKRYAAENPDKFPGNYITKKMPAQTGVYKISCQLTDDFYIGCSTNIRGRVYKHRKAQGKGKQKNLYKLIREYGWEAFDVEILELCDKKVMFERETHYIQLLQPNLNTNKK